MADDVTSKDYGADKIKVLEGLTVVVPIYELPYRMRESGIRDICEHLQRTIEPEVGSSAMILDFACQPMPSSRRKSLICRSGALAPPCGGDRSGGGGGAAAVQLLPGQGDFRPLDDDHLNHLGGQFLLLLEAKRAVIG